MKRRIINFGDIQLIGAVGEWGLVLTDLAGAMGKISSCHSTENLYGQNGLMPSNPCSSFHLLFAVSSE
jgi:hypothetical protein